MKFPERARATGCCYCQLAQVVNEQKQRDRSGGEWEKEKETESSMLPREEQYRNRSSGNCRRGVERSF